MALYKVQIRLCSSIITPLKGDTIWGHIVWGIANHEGDSAVEQFLELCGKNGFTVSSAFPSGLLPRPIPHPQERIENMTADDYAKIKLNKKHKLVSANLFLKNVDTVKMSGEKFFEATTVTHNSINRFSNIVEDGKLYSVQELYSEKGRNIFDIYISTELGEERIYELFMWAFENGYGNDASSGKGVIEVLNPVSKVEPKYQTTEYLALGPFVKSPEITEIRGDIFVRAGKVGGMFSSYMNPFKKTVILYDEGSVIKTSKEVFSVGGLLGDIHSDKRIKQSGFTPVISIPENYDSIIKEALK